MRKEVTEPCSTLSILFELPVGTGDWEGLLAGSHAGEALGALNEPFLALGLSLRIEFLEEFLAVMLIKQGLVIEEVLL